MIAQVSHPYSPEDYLAREIASDIRHEYIDGALIPTTGGTPNHNRIAGNLYAALNLALKHQPYEVFVTDQRIWIPKKRIYTYPDIFVVQGSIQLQEGRNDTLTNPALIIEVLSESTRAYDKDGKFAAYRTIPSFREYLLVDQYQMQIDHYSKTDTRKWSFLDYEGADAILTLDTVPFELSLADIYHKVNFGVSRHEEA